MRSERLIAGSSSRVQSPNTSDPTTRPELPASPSEVGWQTKKPRFYVAPPPPRVRPAVGAARPWRFDLDFNLVGVWLGLMLWFLVATAVLATFAHPGASPHRLTSVHAVGGPPAP